MSIGYEFVFVYDRNSGAMDIIGGSFFLFCEVDALLFL